MSATHAEETLTGVLERIIFFNEENQFCIAELRSANGKEATTITGQLSGAQCGETIEARGSWTKHPTHGKQFKVTHCKVELPASVYGIRKYLGSGLVKGVSQGLAERIVSRFGEQTLEIISHDSGRLQEVGGIGKHRARSIKEAWEEQRTQRELFIFGQTYGLSPAMCLRLHKQYGGEATRIMQSDPFRVAREVSGIGFKTADKVGINSGIPNDSPTRIDAGIEYVLQQAQDEGHTAYPEEALRLRASETLQSDAEIISQGLQRLIESKSIIVEAGEENETYLQLRYNQIAEEKVARSIDRLTATPSGLPPIKIPQAVEWAESKAGFEFADAQKSAIANALYNKAFIITGGPGTGKTTILRALVSILKAKKARVLLAAPTGRAAQRLTETTGGYAQTIHRLLKFDPANSSFTVNEESPLNTDIVIVDEASMLDTRLASSLLQSIPAAAHLVLVGDVDQLPSVGAGNVLKDLIASQRVGVTRLELIFRQSKQSSIVSYAHHVNSGDAQLPKLIDSVDGLSARFDFQFLVAREQEDCAYKTLLVFKNFIKRRLGKDPIKDAQALAPLRKGAAGVGNLNRLLQVALNPAGQAIRMGIESFKPGDKVMQTRNNYDKSVFNGDMGIVTAIDAANEVIDIDFDGRKQSYDKSEMIDLSLAYAISIHKSQGSEYPIVVIPLLKAHFMMLQRNLIYTAITRGKRKVIIVGDPAAYAMATQKSDSKTRCTFLKERLHSPA